MRLPLCLVGAALLVGAGCDAVSYSPDTPVPVGDGEAFVTRLTLEGVTADTLVVSTVTDFRFDVRAPGGRSLRLFMDGQPAGTLRPTDTYRFDPSRVPFGYHTFAVEVAGMTGSPADSLFARVGRGQWTLFADGTAPPAPAGVTADVEQGFMRVAWSPIANPAFVAYEVRRDNVVRAVISDRTDTAWSDSGYAGGRATYTVALRTRGGLSSTDWLVDVAIPRPTPRVRPDGYATVDAEWPALRSVAAVVVERDAGGLGYFQVATLRSPSERVTLDPAFGFGAPVRYRLRPIPLVAPPPEVSTPPWRLSEPVEFVSGTPVVSPDELRVSGEGHRYGVSVVGGERRLVRIGTDGATVLATGPVLPTGTPWFATRSGRVFVSSAPSVPVPPPLAELDPLTLAPLRAHAFPKGTPRYVFGLDVTADGLFAYTSAIVTPNGTVGTGLTLARGGLAPIGTQYVPVDSSLPVRLSPDGTTVVVGTTALTVVASDGALSVRERGGSVVSPQPRSAFTPDLSLFTLTFLGGVALHRTSDGRRMRELSLPGQVQSVALDPVSGLLGVHYDAGPQAGYALVDPLSGTVVATAPVAADGVSLDPSDGLVRPVLFDRMLYATVAGVRRSLSLR